MVYHLAKNFDLPCQSRRHVRVTLAWLSIVHATNYRTEEVPVLDGSAVARSRSGRTNLVLAIAQTVDETAVPIREGAVRPGGALYSSFHVAGLFSDMAFGDEQYPHLWRSPRVAPLLNSPQVFC